MSNINKTQESGRSMVEMLGVLAVIGVLSVAGIAGYTTAMNKYKANEILNGASVRAMHVSAKLQQNSEAEILTALSEFGTEKVAGASFKSVSASGNNFTLTLEDVSMEACTQITNLVGENGNVKVNSDCTTFTYNNDLSAPVTIVSSGSYDGPTEDETGCVASEKLGTECQVCSKGQWIDSDAKCTTAGSTCVDGTCTTLTNSCPSSGGTCRDSYQCLSNYEYYCTSDSDCAGSTYDSTSGMCVRTTGTDETACSKNSDCKSGEFCNYHGAVDCSNGPNGKVGKCEDVEGAGTEITSSDYTGMPSSSTWLLSNNYMDWFSSKNFCLANHMQMVSLADIGCTYDGDAHKYVCTWSNFSGSLASTYWWTKDLTGGVNSCKAYYVATFGNSVYTEVRNRAAANDVYYVLCK